MWKEVTSYPVCAALVLKGDRQGQVCGKAAVKGQAFCMCHTPREKTEKPAKVQLHCSECPTVIRKGQVQCKEHRVYAMCDVVLVKGSRKGEVCGKKGVCPRHNGKEVKEKTQVVVEEKSVQVKQEPVEEESSIPPPVVMATAAASTSLTTTKEKKEKVVKEKIAKEKKEKIVKQKKEKTPAVVEEKVQEVVEKTVQVKQEPVEEESPIPPPVVMATAAASTAVTTTEQKKEKIVKEKKEKIVKEKKDKKEKAGVVVPMVPPPIMIPAPEQVTEQQVLVRSPHTPDHPPPPHIKELFRSLNKQ
jgi:hypothetical protein